MQKAIYRCITQIYQVATAVRFLENDRVRTSTDDMKRKFLLKKGLNEGEIREEWGNPFVTNVPINPT